ncbi:MAG: DUF763 domain-containing protein [Candidatus Auribacterota bacterium]|nr:DUF763 domain-containing protein [Candidatus Auribacterota bacterium]
MARTGIANLPLHYGRAPAWLFGRMRKLARAVILIMAEEEGPEEIIRRLSDPFWFQAFGCVLGFDWHSSGLTTTVCGALKAGLKGTERDTGLYICGGKGAASRKTPDEIRHHCAKLRPDGEELVYASRLSAKVDNTALQDGYQLYHHTFFFSSGGSWAVIQQGMSDATRYARRYHWLEERMESFVSEPHRAICCELRGEETFNLTARESREAREGIVNVTRLTPLETVRELKTISRLDLPTRHRILPRDLTSTRMGNLVQRIEEEQPESFEKALLVRGLGPKSLRALNLLSELIYGTRVATRDPARYSFAHGGKDGIPYPVDRETYDHSISILEEMLNKSRIDYSEKRRAFARLSRFQSPG